MKIQIDIPKELNKKLKIYRIKRDHQNMQESVIDILKRFFEKYGEEK